MGILANIIRSIYRKRNFQITIRPVRNSGLIAESEILLPNADYAPWKTDFDFQKIYKLIEGNSLVDIYRCWELWDVLDSIVTSVEGDIIEIGVWRGGTGAIMASKLNRLDSSRKIYLADTFEGVVKATKKDSQYTGGEHSDTSSEIVENLLANTLNLKNFKILKGVFPDETASMIQNPNFALVHVDVDVYQSSKEIVEWVWPHLSVGGIIVFDDYGWTNCDGVITFVNEQKRQPDRHTIYNLNGHAIVIKLA